MALDKNLKNLKILLSAMEDDHLGKEEFIKSFESVVQLIQKMQIKNQEEITELQNLYETTVVSLKDKNRTDIAEVKEQVMSYCMKEMENMMTAHTEKMEAMDAKIASVVNGKDADEVKIVQDVLTQIKLPEYKETVLDTPEQLRDKLESLEGGDRLDKDSIKGLQEEMASLKELIVKVGTSRGGGGPNANAVQSFDISSQFDGVLKVFQIPRHRVALMLISSQFPIIFRPTTDFTTANVALNLTAEVSAPTAGQTGIFLYIK